MLYYGWQTYAVGGESGASGNESREKGKGRTTDGLSQRDKRYH